MLAALALAAALVSTAPPAAPPPSAPQTRAHLAAAHEADALAEARFAAFAKQADVEGYAAVARLFRAAALSERIRAAAHADALRALGAEPRPVPPPPTPASRTTEENLRWVLAHESVERSASYPRYVQAARAEGSAHAVLDFLLAQRVETALVALYQEAVGALERTRRPGEALFVCPTCGTIVRGRAPERCPVSLSPGEAFVRVD
jgi:rubrerythrin